MDGIPKPPALQPYLAAYDAERTRRKQPRIQAIQGQHALDTVEALDAHDESQQEEDDDAQGSQQELDEEAQEALRQFAEMRGVMRLVAKSGMQIRFHVNDATGLVDVVMAESGEVLLSLTQEDMMSLFGKIHRYAGLLADRSG